MTNGNAKTSGAIALSWWASLQPARDIGYKGDTGALARLRRASLIDAMTEEAVVRLHRRLGLARQDFPRAALIACVLAHVREHAPRLKAAQAAGAPPGEENGVLSQLRFRRLLAVRGEEDCLIAFRRLVALLGGKVNVVDLAQSLLDWNDEENGDRRRTRWAFDYYDAGAGAPDDAPDPATETKPETMTA
jgi:CRISPR system Cascade subunit CasB